MDLGRDRSGNVIAQVTGLNVRHGNKYYGVSDRHDVVVVLQVEADSYGIDIRVRIDCGMKSGSDYSQLTGTIEACPGDA